MNNVILLIDLLVRLATQLQSVGALIRKAQSEGRDVTEAELDVLSSDYEAARAELKAAIAAKRAGGGTG